MILLRFSQGKNVGAGEGNYHLLKDICETYLLLKFVLPSKSADCWSQINLRIVVKVVLEFPDLEFR